MEMTREIYWNVGTGVLVPMYVLLFVTLAALVWSFRKRIKIYKRGKKEDRTQNLPRRIVYALINIILQKKVIREKTGGIAHSFFFWGFLLLLLGTFLIFLQADILGPLFGINFLQGDFYKIYSLVLDIAGLVAMIALGKLMIRRYIQKPKGLMTIWEDHLVYALLFAILITGYFIEGARMAATEVNQNPVLARYSPVGLAVAQLFMGMSAESLSVVHKILWWLHFVLVMGFFIAIPLTKFKHIITTSTNYLFSNMGDKPALKTLDMEDEEAETFGVSKVEEFTWKDIFDGDACTKCKRCQDECPAFHTDKPLSPMKVIHHIGQSAFKENKKTLIETIGKDALWSCTTCMACMETCPADIEHIPKIVDMRRNLVLMEGEFPGDEVMTAMNNTEVNGNPLGLAFADRGNWAEGLDITLMEKDSKVDILYYVGCYASFDSRNIAIAKSFVKICNSAGIKVGILGKKEKCCGDPVRKMGNEYLYQALATENIEALEATGVQKIVTTCPHCFNTLSNDYKDLGLKLETLHYTTFLYDLMKKGKLNFSSSNFDCTYHDSCYLGRHNNIYVEPRELIKAAGGKIKEMERSKEKSFCCGAGGGRIMAEETLGTRINAARIEMVNQTQTGQVISNCPFCMTMMDDAIKTASLEEKIYAKDIAEILAERV